MKIALIAPPYPLEEAPSPPLGLCYVAAACEAAGAEVVILDYIVSRYTPDKLKTSLDAFRPDVVGATSVTMNFPETIRIIQDVKRHNPDIITMMGGPHVSFAIEDTLNNYPELDLIVIGEGEQTLSELVPVLTSPHEWEGIRGIAFRNAESITVTAPRELINDLDTLPLPARHLLPVSRYQALGFPVSIITSRGCPNKCIFCLGRRMVGFRGRFRTPKLVVEEIEHILDYGFTRINIADDLFTANKNRVMTLCEEIMNRGVKFTWSAFARVNTVDAEILSIMKKAGCDSVSFGIESGNPEMLRRIRKGITLDQARNAVACCKEAGLIAHASFMVGLPGDTMESLRDTERFARELGIVYGYHFLAPFPGTTVREDIEHYDLKILTDDWSCYDANRPVVQTKSLTPEQMLAFVREFENEQDLKWKQTEHRYKEHTCSPYEQLLVDGHKRMNLIYKILSEDIIEETRLISPTTKEDASMLLSSSIAKRLGLATDYVHTVIKSLMSAGYIRHEAISGGLNFYWTHNRFREKSPVA